MTEENRETEEVRNESRSYYKLQYFNEGLKKWCETSAQPVANPDYDNPPLEVWRAYLQYMNVADHLAYRLVKVTTTVQEVTVNV